MGHALGRRLTAHIVVENSYVDGHRRRRSASATRRSAPTGCSRSATRATTAARRSTRGSASRAATSTACATRFSIDDYPVSGLLTGEFHLTGEYERPIGFGAMTIDDGVAYGEPFQKRDRVAALRRHRRAARRHQHRQGHRRGDRRGVRRLGLAPTRSTPTAAGFRSSALAFVRIRSAPLSGLAEFTADRQRHVRRAALRRPVPRQRSVRRRGRRRPGHRHAGAARRRS